jgi:multidrug efflux pump subunit AcrA (membrane-fusion protein)
MTVVAEIKARDRTVLSYLTKPITRTLAMEER